MIFREKTLSSEKIYEGKILNLRKDKVTVVSGESYREIVEHNGAAVIIPILDNGQVIMVKQFRKPAEKVMLELPAGKLEPDENPEDAALRELREETGYTAGRIRFITKMYPSVGYSEEILHLYLCTDLKKGRMDLDENEAIDVEAYEIEQLVDMILNGTLEDGKSQAGILIARELISREGLL